MKQTDKSTTITELEICEQLTTTMINIVVAKMSALKPTQFETLLGFLQDTNECIKDLLENIK
jgi:hypothetical protein